MEDREYELEQGISGSWSVRYSEYECYGGFGTIEEAIIFAEGFYL